MKWFSNDIDTLVKLISPKSNVYLSFKKNVLIKNDNASFACADQFRHKGFESENILVCDHEPEKWWLYDVVISDRLLPYLSQYNHFEFKGYTNPDGTLRWLAPVSDRSAAFLHTYSPVSRKGRAMKQTIQALTKTGIDRIINRKRLHLYIPVKNRKIAGVNPANLNVFMGTRGPNRKALVLNGAAGNHDIIKVPVTGLAQYSIRKESLNYSILKGFKSRNIIIPATQFIDNRLQMERVGGQVNEGMVLEESEKMALLDMSQFMRKSVFAEDSVFFENIDKRLQLKRTKTSLNKAWSYAEKLRKSISLNQILITSWAHKDFTPWNTFRKREKLVVIDWETASAGTPILYDYFHYIIQSMTLVGNQDARAIIACLEKDRAGDFIQKILKDNQQQYFFYLSAYLQDVMSFYLSQYEKQNEKLHPQSYWLIRNWIKLASWVEANLSGDSMRAQCINEVVKILGAKQHAFLKLEAGHPAQIAETSDLDICIQRKDLNHVIKSLKSLPFVFKVQTKKKSFMTVVNLYFHDGSFLSIDLIYGFKRKALTFLSAQTVLKNRVKNEEGIVIPAKKHDAEYIWAFYQLNGADIPEKYKRWFTDEVMDYLTGKYSLPNAQSIFKFSHELSKSIKKYALSRQQKPAVFRILTYLADTARELRSQKGIIITVSGVDGAGKSTLLENLKERIEKKYRRKLVVLRHRPSLLPILSAYRYGKKNAEKRAATTLPRQGENSSLLNSVFRFAYYYLDYLFGQVYVYLRYQSRGYVVLYDRYYFDFISDGKRSNISLPYWITRPLYTFVTKPALNIFLYANPEVILARKQELTQEDIIALTKSYKGLFDGLSLKNPDRYLSINNIDLEETIRKTEKAFINAA